MPHPNPNMAQNRTLPEDEPSYSGKTHDVTNPFTQTTPQPNSSMINAGRAAQYSADNSISVYQNQQPYGSYQPYEGARAGRSSEKKQQQDTSYTYTLQQPFAGQTQEAVAPTAAFGHMPVTNQQYHETSSDQSDYGEDEESESSSGGDGEDYGEEDES